MLLDTQKFTRNTVETFLEAIEIEEHNFYCFFFSVTQLARTSAQVHKCDAKLRHNFFIRKSLRKKLRHKFHKSICNEKIVSLILFGNA